MSALDSDRPRTGSYRPSTDVGEGANEDFLFHLYRGSELLGDNRVLEAKEELESALRLSPRDAKGQDLLAVVYFRLGLYPRAISIFEGLKRGSPRDPALKLNLSLCYLKTGQSSLARQELEELTLQNPNHTRAWGYLGLAYERLGELQKAESAFALGNHPQMARRMAEKLAQSEKPPADAAREHFTEPAPMPEVSTTYVDSSPPRGASPSERSAAEDAAPSETVPVEGASPSERSRGESESPPERSRSEAIVPPTKASPPPGPPAERTRDSDATVVIHAVLQPEETREAEEGAQRPSPLLRSRPHVQLARAVLTAPIAAGATPTSDDKPTVVPDLGVLTEERTMPSAVSPFAGMRVSRGEPHVPAAREVPGRPAAPEIPPFGAPYDITVVHDQLALVRLDGQPERGFAARLSAIRSMTTSLTTSVLEKRTRAKTSETFGGTSNPMVDIRGTGEIVLGVRHGQTLVRFAVGPEAWFLREDTLIALDLGLVFENGRLTTSEGEHVGLVQVRGKGAVLVEFPRTSLALDVKSGQGVSAKKDAVLGWTGRIVPRALPPGEAPCGQRGMLAFAGEGQVFLLT